MEKSIYACIYANIWVNQLCECMHAKMDFPDGEIIFLVPVWISPFEKSKLLQNVLISQLGKSIYAGKTVGATLSLFPKVERRSGGGGWVGWGVGSGGGGVGD